MCTQFLHESSWQLIGRFNVPGLAEADNRLGRVSVDRCLNWKTGHQIVRIKILWILLYGGVATDGSSD